ncbi:MAG TPA: helix-turn-helix domain-containing protein [Candidatus Nanoarchaeia archaeon]|nr:helix-turn-helix domain-containing protein [Candidatus Nanoarchaeia archaeon]
MIVKEDFLSNIRRYFDLNLYEVKLWSALLSRGVSTAGELSDIADVPRSRSYDVLESLEKKGYVVMKLGKPIKYLAVPPSEVVERVKKNMHSDAEEKIARLESLKQTELLKELELLHTQGIELVEPSELSGAIRGRHNLYNHMEQAIRESKKRITLMTTPQGLVRKVEGLKSALEQASKRGVDIRIAAPLTKETAEAVKSLKGIADVRHIDTVKSRFCVVDSKNLVFTVLDDKDVHPTYDVGIWVNTPFFASALDNLFDLTWDSLKPSAGKLPK